MAFRGLRYVALAGVIALAGCVLPGGGGGKTAAPNPVTGGSIEVTPLDAGPASDAAKPEMAAAAAAPAALPAKAPAAGDTRPKPRPAAVSPATPEVVVAAPVVAPAVPEAAKSPSQIACERKKGLWSKAGKGGFACISRTRDSGKECRSAKQCEGECLARSGTCAPFKPLFGCNEILDDMGRRTTLCID